MSCTKYILVIYVQCVRRQTRGSWTFPLPRNGSPPVFATPGRVRVRGWVRGPSGSSSSVLVATVSGLR